MMPAHGYCQSNANVLQFLLQFSDCNATTTSEGFIDTAASLVTFPGTAWRQETTQAILFWILLLFFLVSRLMQNTIATFNSRLTESGLWYSSHCVGASQPHDTSQPTEIFDPKKDTQEKLFCSFQLDLWIPKMSTAVVQQIEGRIPLFYLSRSVFQCQLPPSFTQLYCAD